MLINDDFVALIRSFALYLLLMFLSQLSFAWFLVYLIVFFYPFNFNLCVLIL